MKLKNMREYTHEEFVNLVLSLSEDELLNLSKNYGGYPVLFRMALDSRICHIPFIQTGAAIVIENDKVKYYFKKERIEINGDYQEDAKSLEKI